VVLRIVSSFVQRFGEYTNTAGEASTLLLSEVTFVTKTPEAKLRHSVTSFILPTVKGEGEDSMN